MTTTYLFEKSNRTHTMFMQRQAISIIQSFFSKYNTLIGKPLFTVKSNKIIVQIFYYSTNKSIHTSNLHTLSNALTQCWDRSIELRLVRLNHAVLDSTIFTQYLSANSNKYSFNRLFDMLKTNLLITVAEGSGVPFHENAKEILLTSHITGVKVKLSGRLTTQRSGPRQTVKTDRLGSSAKGKYGMTDFNQFTSKNKLGAFTMKVWMDQQML